MTLYEWFMLIEMRPVLGTLAYILCIVVSVLFNLMHQPVSEFDFLLKAREHFSQ